jgi:transposase-like protein
MNADEKLARQRLSVLELAKALGNVSEACRRRGMTRTQFYEYKRRCQTQGLAGRKDRSTPRSAHHASIAFVVKELGIDQLVTKWPAIVVMVRPSRYV